MTRIDCINDGRHYMLDLKGHTETRICAGISTIMCTLASVVDADDTAEVTVLQIEPGDTHLEFYTNDDFTKNSFEFVCIALLKLWYSYPDTIVFEDGFIKKYLSHVSHGETELEKCDTVRI